MQADASVQNSDATHEIPSWVKEMHFLTRMRNEHQLNLVKHLTHGQKRKIFRTLRSHLTPGENDNSSDSKSAESHASNSINRRVNHQYACRHVIVCRIHEPRGSMFSDSTFEESRKPRVEGRGWDPESELCRVAAIPVSDFSLWYVAQGFMNV